MPLDPVWEDNAAPAPTPAAPQSGPIGPNGEKPGQKQVITIGGRNFPQTWTIIDYVEESDPRNPLAPPVKTPIYGWADSTTGYPDPNAPGGSSDHYSTDVSAASAAADRASREAIAAAERRLQSMTSSLSSFLQAQSLADARKLAATQEFQKMAQFSVPAGTNVMPGWEEGGPMQALAAVRGRPEYQARGVQTQHVDPSQINQAGAVPPEVAAMIAQLQGAA